MGVLPLTSHAERVPEAGDGLGIVGQHFQCAAVRLDRFRIPCKRLERSSRPLVSDGEGGTEIQRTPQALPPRGIVG